MTTVTIAKTEKATVKYINTSLPPTAGDCILYKRKIRRVIAVIPEKNLIIIERFKYKLGIYQEIPYKDSVAMKPFAVTRRGEILGRIPDRENDNLLDKQQITGNIKTKLIPIDKGAEITVVRVSPDSSLIWTKNKTGTIEFVEHPTYIVKIHKAGLTKFHRNQIRTIDRKDEEVFFINVQTS